MANEGTGDARLTENDPGRLTAPRYAILVDYHGTPMLLGQDGRSMTATIYGRRVAVASFETVDEAAKKIDEVKGGGAWPTVQMRVVLVCLTVEPVRQVRAMGQAAGPAFGSFP